MNEHEMSFPSGEGSQQEVQFPDPLPEEEISLVLDLQQVHRSYTDKNTHSLERVWRQIVQSTDDLQNGQHTALPDDERVPPRLSSSTPGPGSTWTRSPRRWQQIGARVQTLVAVLVVCALLGAFLALLASHGKEPADHPLAPPSSCGNWSIVSSPNPGPGFSQLNGVAAISANNVWAVGYTYSKVNNISQPLIEQWNGTSWRIMQVPAFRNAFLTGIAAISANDIWTIGSFTVGQETQPLIEHWNGSSWSVFKSLGVAGEQNVLKSITAISPDDIWAVGSSFNGFQQALIEHWNGTSWRIVRSPSVQDAMLFQVAAVSANNIWAVGSYSTGRVQPLFEHWNGSSWSIIQSPTLPSDENVMSGVAAVSANDVWAVGTSVVNLPVFKARTLVEHWDGSAWSIVTSPNPWPENNTLASVVALSASNVWAVGGMNTGTMESKPLIEHWNGKTWSVVEGLSMKNTELADVIQVPHTGKIWAVGASFNVGRSSQTFTAFYC